MVRTVGAAIQLLRPAQWVKNIFVLSALVFSTKNRDPHAIFIAFAAFGIFCMLSSAVYAFNDLLDYKEDAKHPTKKKRPIASGKLSPALGGIISITLACVATFLATRLPPGFTLTAVAYLILNLFYSLGGKKIVLLDVILIAIGFVLRALAGAEAIEVEVSAWLVICTFALCLFLGFGKRRCELAVMNSTENAAHHHRATLIHYTPDLLSQLLSSTGMMAVVTFLLYTLDPNTPSPHSMVFTTPLVFYAIFRYAMVITRGERTGPTDVLIRDRPFLVTAILWTVFTLALVFQGSKIDKYLPRLRYPGFPAAAQPAPQP